MKKLKLVRSILWPAGLCLAVCLTAAPGFAQEKLGDGAMGALAGAVVAGPVGLVAGGIIGYTAGPGIARSWGLKGHRHVHHARYRQPAK
jgi:hypothetical protein